MSLPRLYSFVHVHAQVCVEVDESAQPVQICAQTGNPVISVAKKGWFADVDHWLDERHPLPHAQAYL